MTRFNAPAQVIRVVKDRDRSLLLRGWTRLCLHAASLNAAEGASAAATAAARAARADAMQVEAAIATEKAEALRLAAAARPEAAMAGAGREDDRKEVADVFTGVAELERRAEESERVTREQLKRRLKMAVRCNAHRRPLR